MTRSQHSSSEMWHSGLAAKSRKGTDDSLLHQNSQVNGLTGKMGQAVAEAASRVVGLELIPLCLSFPRGDERYLRVGEVNVEIQHPSQKDAVLDRIVQDFPGVIVVDYTLPAAVNGELDFLWQ